MAKVKRLALMTAALLLGTALSAQTHTFEIKDGNFVRDGKPVQIYSGEIHYSRVPAAYWRHRIQMIKAMGLNTVATYVFWSFHETAPGVWDWTTDSHNIREFMKICAEEDMMVILRPGPYSCGEWDFGGYPWWLPNKEGLEVRTLNKPFLEECSKYLSQLVDQVRDLQVTHGGPIVMVQAENEFGSYVAQRPDIPLETHREYNAAIAQMLREKGIDVPLFTSDGSWLFEGGTIKGVLPTANGESDIDNLRKCVNEYNGGQGPYMVAEFYPGWLDHWNEEFVRVATKKVVGRLENYLKNNVSFNFYMVHGGTNFGFTAGANYSNDVNIQPDLTSYDYDAPISEAGWATEKYNAIRETMLKYADYEIPAVPQQIPVIEIKDIKLGRAVSLFDMVENVEPEYSDRPMTFEQLGLGNGYVLYRRHFNQPIKGLLKVSGIADYGLVYINGKRIGELNRLTGADSLEVDLKFNSTLDILVESMGHINYGARITQNDKGIILPVTIAGREITGDWEMYRIPFDKEPDLKSYSDNYVQEMPVVYSGTFKLKKAGDTFVDMEQWGKGIVFVNGINLGRYWKVGPQQTLYLPGCYLKKGLNTITIFEQQNDERKTSISCVAQPVLDKLVK
ncbi:MAG: beta-galactosidase [Bacteroidales bacterium]|nr:beta-galactosidase [Bacteroidales bacterium]